MKKLYIILLSFIIATTVCAQYKYLGSFTNDGKPLYLTTNDIVTSKTLSLIQAALPESKPVPLYNPQYIYSGYSTDIKLKDSAEVWVTFVDEGAGFKNVLGFYTYNLNNPLSIVPNTNDITIIFPNVSKLGFGGSLEAGNKVKIGNFAANTGIGFILIADGWRGGSVTNGNWKLYSESNFNPESNKSKRQHVALIADSLNSRIILGFEDVRRDLNNCDNDFNDALFYITASPYSAIITDNYAPIDTSSSEITSSNDGGLESNGKLANKIAKQLFLRQKNNTNKLAIKAYQKQIPNVALESFTGQLKDYLPTTGLNGTENAFESTPNDLKAITNATNIYAIDYYLADKRVNAALVTHTQSEVYNHTKYICDRLNGAILMDVRTMELDEFKLISTTLKRKNGEIEHALTFSALVKDSSFTLYSLWNIEQYPAGEYLNFQIWGSSVAQIYNTANVIIDKLKQQKSLISTSSLTNVPSIYIKKGTYTNGKFLLTIANKSNAKVINFASNYRRTETDASNALTKQINLSGYVEEQVQINIGKIFDAGISISQTGVLQQDVLYLADGAWGTDFDANYSKNIDFQSVPSANKNDDNGFLSISRDVIVKGINKGTFNLFRSIMPGSNSINLSAYKNISFELESNCDVELIIVENDLSDWSKRKKYQIKANSNSNLYNIDLNNLVDEDGKKLNLESIKSIVFSLKGNYSSYVSFDLKVKNVNFNNTTISTQENTNVFAYPNPCTTKTNLHFDNNITEANLFIVNAIGKTVLTKGIKIANNSYSLDVSLISKGIYYFKTVSKEGKISTGKLVIN